MPLGSTMPGSRRRSFLPDPALLADARAAGERAGLSSVHVGPIATGDQIVFDDGIKRWLHTAFAALAVENEGAAVAQVAHCHGLPWLVVRGISDLADSAAGLDFSPFLVYAEDGLPPRRLSRLQRILQQELRQPGTVRALRRFRQGVHQAMTSVSLFLDVFLPTTIP